jgi:hypothetical protein
VLMFRGAMEDNRPLACLTPPVTPHKIMQHPARRRLLNPLPRLVGTRRLMLFERFTEAVCQSGLHQHTDRHDHQQGHEALGLVQIPRRGEPRWVFQKTAPALCRPLPFVAFPNRLRRQLGEVECMGGQDDTPGLVDEGLAGRERGSQGPVDLVDHLGGSSLLSGSAPCAIAGRCAHRAGAQQRGVPCLLKG